MHACPSAHCHSGVATVLSFACRLVRGVTCGCVGAWGVARWMGVGRGMCGCGGGSK